MSLEGRVYSKENSPIGEPLGEDRGVVVLIYIPELASSSFASVIRGQIKAMTDIDI